jgi:hypothetical protein
MYEGGRFKRKRDYSSDNEDESDGEDSRRKRDPNAYDANMAKIRTNIIRSIDATTKIKHFNSNFLTFFKYRIDLNSIKEGRIRANSSQM